MKLPRDVSGPRAIKAFVRLGFERGNQKGSHVRLSRGSIRVTVPNHPSLAVGTLKSILRQANVTIEEFIDKL